jgi:hypothetical protein
MQIALEALIRRSPHFDEKVWGGTTTDAKLSIEYELINHIDSTRQAYTDYLARFTTMINEIKAVHREGKSVQYATAKEITSTVLQVIYHPLFSFLL